MNSFAIVVLAYALILHTDCKTATLTGDWILILFALCLAELIYNFYVLLTDKGFAWSSKDLKDAKHKYAFDCDFPNLPTLENGCSSVKTEETYSCAQKCADNSECGAYISVGKKDAQKQWCCLKKGKVDTNNAEKFTDKINGNPSVCGLITRML